MYFAAAQFDGHGDMKPALYCMGCAEKRSMRQRIANGLHWQVVPLQDSQDVAAFCCDDCGSTQAEYMPLHGSAMSARQVEAFLNA